MVNRQIRLPVELWVAICGLLSPKDQRSLAKSCTRLFAIVHLNPPSTVVRIDHWRVRSTGSKSKDRLHLRSATEVHWRGWKHNQGENKRFHAVLSVLPTVSNICLLSLRDVEINKAQQAIIFGLSTLRTLVVHSCRFYPSTKPLPLSPVTALKVSDTDEETIRRLLTLLATTLESLEVDSSTICSTLQGGLIELPKLSTFTINRDQHSFSAPNLAMLDTFKRYTSITTISIFCYYSLSEIPFHHSDLPALCSLTCDDQLAMIMIPKRPVTTYVEIGHLRKPGQLDLLNALSKTRARITRLTLFVPYETRSVLPSLATYLQHLEQLTLRSNAIMPWSPQAGIILPKLKWVTVWIIPRDWTSRFEWLLEHIIPTCPALEVLEYLGTLSEYSMTHNLPPVSRRAWRVQRLPDGSWERLGPPPIPTPPAPLCGQLPAAP